MIEKCQQIRKWHHLLIVHLIMPHPVYIYIYIYCDRTHEWRATSSRVRDLRNLRKQDL